MRDNLYKYFVQAAYIADPAEGYRRMKTVNISEFRANLLKYLEKARSGETISVTSNGKVLATVSSPIDEKQAARERLQAIARSARIGDIVSPQDEAWEAQA